MWIALSVLMCCDWLYVINNSGLAPRVINTGDILITFTTLTLITSNNLLTAIKIKKEGKENIWISSCPYSTFFPFCEPRTVISLCFQHKRQNGMIEVILILPCLIHVLRNTFYNNNRKAHAIIMEAERRTGSGEGKGTFLHGKLTFWLWLNVYL